MISVYDFLTQLGIRVYVFPFIPNGKALHIKGFLDRFKAVARRNVETLSQAARYGVPIVGIDPAITLSYRDEYPKILGKTALDFKVYLIQEWLIERLPFIKKERPSLFQREQPLKYCLFSHCTEKTAVPESPSTWQSVFALFGQKLELIRTGCCGMGGTYGHESEHYHESKRIFDMSWRVQIDRLTGDDINLLVTGYSCRSQAKRFAGIKTLHPIEALLNLLH
jgi:Fe-S oxidoreductase